MLDRDSDFGVLSVGAKLADIDKLRNCDKYVLLLNSNQ